MGPIKYNYTSLPDVLTIDYMLQMIFPNQYNINNILCIEDYLDYLESALYITFNQWYSKKVRLEQRKITRNNKNNRCQICGKFSKCELHHIVHVSQGGGNEKENIIFLCHDCHKMQSKNLNKGQINGNKLITEKSIICKNIILRESSAFGGLLSDKELIQQLGIARNTYYKYKKELKGVD